MNVLLGVEPLYAPLTGIGWYTKHLASGLAVRRDISDLRYFAHGRVLPRPPLRKEAGHGGASSRAVGVLPGLRHRLRSVVAGSSLAVRVYEAVLPLLARHNLERFACSHVLHSPNFVLPAFSGRKVVTFHDLSTLLMPHFHPPARAGFVNRAMERAVTDADHVITDSEFVRRQVLDHFGLAAKRCSAIPLGADDAFRPRDERECARVLASYGLHFKRYFLFLSTVEPRKNLRRILHAFQSFSHRRRSRVPLVIVGDPGWRSGREHAMLRRLHQAGLVRYLGYAPPSDLPVLVAAARVLVFASLYEGFGLPVLEAMQSGTAVLTSQNSAMEEVCGPAALCIDPCSVHAISDGLELLLDDDRLVDRLVAAGLRRAGEFSWSRCVELTLEVYKGLHAP